jgi:glutamate-1-semialdehyde 2,1-aminomutase
VGVEAALATIAELEDGTIHERVVRLGLRMRDGLEEIARRAGIPAVVGGFGSLFVLCFMEGPLRSYEDVLRNDTELFLRYRRELVARGVFEPRPQPHLGGAHRRRRRPLAGGRRGRAARGTLMSLARCDSISRCRGSTGRSWPS